MTLKNPGNILNTAIYAALLAGWEILDIYNNHDFNVEFKDDNSPLTVADKAAHKIISAELSQTNIPILSEEGKHQAYSERKDWEYLWVVDPLDGTKEFIKRNGEFTVNIALINNQKSVLGIIYSPVLRTLYFNYLDGEAFMVKDIKPGNNISDIVKMIQTNKTEIPQSLNRKYRVVASRSHLSDKTKEFIEGIKIKHPQLETVSMGSSLKLCLIANGEADIYPRFAPTMEWDTAAGHAIVKAAGGNVTNYETNKEVLYNKENLLNPWFIAKTPPSNRDANLKIL
ncbi:MAG: 3'(2'),5'-bisphosphate nucleotidase CysQ [Bacteroidota bacterium]